MPRPTPEQAADRPGRYHLTLTQAGGGMVHGYWTREETAREKFRLWVGEHGQPGARVTLVDEETGKTLDTWPKDPPPSAP